MERSCYHLNIFLFHLLFLIFAFYTQSSLSTDLPNSDSNNQQVPISKGSASSSYLLSLYHNLISSFKPYIDAWSPKSSSENSTSASGYEGGTLVTVYEYGKPASKIYLKMSKTEVEHLVIMDCVQNLNIQLYFFISNLIFKEGNITLSYAYNFVQSYIQQFKENHTCPSFYTYVSPKDFASETPNYSFDDLYNYLAEKIHKDAMVISIKQKSPPSLLTSMSTNTSSSCSIYWERISQHRYLLQMLLYPTFSVSGQFIGNITADGRTITAYEEHLKNMLNNSVYSPFKSQSVEAPVSRNSKSANSENKFAFFLDVKTVFEGSPTFSRTKGSLALKEINRLPPKKSVDSGTLHDISKAWYETFATFFSGKRSNSVNCPTSDSQNQKEEKSASVPQPITPSNAIKEARG